MASFRNVHEGYGSQPIYAGLDFQVRRKERWCVLGETVPAMRPL